MSDSTISEISCSYCNNIIASDVNFCGTCGKPKIVNTLMKSKTTAKYDPYNPNLKPWRLKTPKIESVIIKKDSMVMKNDSISSCKERLNHNKIKTTKAWLPVMKHSNENKRKSTRMQHSPEKWENSTSIDTIEGFENVSSPKEEENNMSSKNEQLVTESGIEPTIIKENENNSTYIPKKINSINTRK